MASAKRPTPVEVVYFPARKGTDRASRTQTVPEVKAAQPPAKDELPTTDEVAVGPQAQRRAADVPGPRVGARSDMAELGHELVEQGRAREARLVFEGLVEADPRDGFAHTMLGTVHLMLGDLPSALSSFETALGLDPNDVAARVYRGEIRLKRRRFSAAAEDFTRALSIADEDSPFHERARRLLGLARRKARA